MPIQKKIPFPLSLLSDLNCNTGMKSIIVWMGCFLPNYKSSCLNKYTNWSSKNAQSPLSSIFVLLNGCLEVPVSAASLNYFWWSWSLARSGECEGKSFPVDLLSHIISGISETGWLKSCRWLMSDQHHTIATGRNEGTHFLLFSCVEAFQSTDQNCSQLMIKPFTWYGHFYFLPPIGVHSIFH